MLEDPLEVGFAVPGIDDQDEPAALDAVDDQVVDDPAALVRQKRVLGTADVDLVDVVREQPLERRRHLRALELEPAHVRDVEHSAVLAHCPVFGNDALVLDGHLPAGEGHHACAERDVTLVERRAEQGLHARWDANDRKDRSAARRSG